MRNGERMQRLVGDILELSRFRSGSVSLQLRRFRRGRPSPRPPVALVAPLAAHARPAPRARRRRRPATTRSTATTGGSSRRCSTSSRTRRSSRPTAARSRSGSRARGDDTAWSVTDAGPGISAGDQERLFERFFVGRNDETGPREGVGLGLPTALAIAQAHGGTIEVDSEPGRGSTFTLVVPTDGPAAGQADEP